MSKHTPGPWSVLDCRKFLWDGRREELHILGAEGESGGHPVLANIYLSKETPVPLATAEANASLIAAAPELLEVLKGMLAHYRIIDGSPSFREAQAAIAKAEGRK